MSRTFPSIAIYFVFGMFCGVVGTSFLLLSPQLPLLLPLHGSGITKSCFELAEGLENFYSDYGRFPDDMGCPNLSGDTRTSTSADTPLISALLGIPDPRYAKWNPRGIAFYSNIASNDLHPYGLYRDESTGFYGLRDEWGSPFVIFFDSNHDGFVSMPTAKGLTQVRARVVVCCTGKDRILGPTSKGKYDDYYSNAK